MVCNTMIFNITEKQRPSFHHNSSTTHKAVSKQCSPVPWAPLNIMGFWWIFHKKLQCFLTEKSKLSVSTSPCARLWTRVLQSCPLFPVWPPQHSQDQVGSSAQPAGARPRHSARLYRAVCQGTSPAAIWNTLPTAATINYSPRQPWLSGRELERALASFNKLCCPSHLTC